MISRDAVGAVLMIWVIGTAIDLTRAVIVLISAAPS